MSLKKEIGDLVVLGAGFPTAMLFSAVVLFIASLVEYLDFDGSEQGLALVMSIILLTSSALYLFIYTTIASSSVANTLFSVFLFVAWGFTAGFVTFEGPFVVPGNGYFGAWLGFVASTANLIRNVSEAGDFWKKAFADGVAFFVLVGGSIVVIIAGISNGCCDGDDLLAIVAGTVSLIFCLIRLLVSGLSKTNFAFLMLAWWSIFGLVLTFAVFEEVGNGYFGVLTCFLASVVLSFPEKATTEQLTQAYSTLRGKNVQAGADDV